MSKTIYIRIVLKNGVIIDDSIKCPREKYKHACKALEDIRENFVTKGVESLTINYAVYRPEDISAMCISETKRGLFAAGGN